MDLNLMSVLLWMGTSVGSSLVASFVLERLKWFQDKTSDQKQWTFFGTCSVLVLSSWATLTYVPVEILEAISTPFTMVAGVFVSVFFGNKFNETDNPQG